MILSTTEYFKAKSILAQLDDTLQWVAEHPTMTDEDKKENTRDIADTRALVLRDINAWEARITYLSEPIGRSFDVVIYLDNHENVVRANTVYRDEIGPFAVERKCYSNVSRSSLSRLASALENIELTPNGDVNQLIVGSAEQLRDYLNETVV